MISVLPYGGFLKLGVLYRHPYIMPILVIGVPLFRETTI